MREIAHLASGPGEALMAFGTPFDCPGFAAAGAVGTRSRAMACSISSTSAAIVLGRFPAP